MIKIRINDAYVKLIYISIFINCLGLSAFRMDFGRISLNNTKVAWLLLIIGELLYLFLCKDYVLSFNGKKSWYVFLFLVVWLLYALVNIVHVYNFNDYFRDITILIQFMTLFVVIIHHITSAEKMFGCLRSIFYAGIFHNCIGWYEYITGKYVYVEKDRVYMFLRERNPVSYFGNCNDFATFLCLVAVISFVLFRCTSKSMRYCYLFVFFSSVSLIILTGSRANILGFILMTIIYLIICNKEISRGKLFLCLVFMFVCATAFIFIKGSFIYDLGLVFNGRGAKESNSVRILLLKNGFSFLLQSGFGGIGAGSVDYWLQNKAEYFVSLSKLHNWFVEILVSYGIIIFAGYICIYYCVLKECFRFVINNDSKNIEYYTKLCIMLFMIGYLFSGMSSGSNFQHLWWWSFTSISITVFNVESDYREDR